MSSLKWYGPNDTLVVGTFKIKGPMVYVATSNTWDEPSAIHTALPVRKPAARRKREDYFPHEEEETYADLYPESCYEELTPTMRWQYLQWLQEGRPKTTRLQFLLLYLQGLERRVIADQKDATLVWDELWRLYPGKFEQRSYVHETFDQFLWCLLFMVGKHARNDHIASLVRQTKRRRYDRYEATVKISMLVVWGVIHYGRLPGWLVFYCAYLHSDSAIGVSLEEAEPETLKLFVAHVKQWDKSVLQLKLPTEIGCSGEYPPQNEALPSLVLHWPNILEQKKQWKKLSTEMDALFFRCVEELRPFASALRKYGVTPESRVAWEALPAMIRPSTHPSREKLWELGGDTLRESGQAGTTAGEVARILEMAKTPALSSMLSKVLPQSLQFCGLCVEPDARLSGRAYRWDDEVLLFTAPAKTQGAFGERDALRYQDHAAFVRCALYVAQAAGEVSQETLLLLDRRLNEVFGLLPQEKQRMQMLAKLLTQREITLKGYRVPPSVQDRLREHLPPLLLEMVRGSGQINTAQEEALALMWKRLGLEKRALTRELDALSSSGVVFIGNNIAGRSGEKLPPPPIGASPTLAFELDHGVIGELLEDTAHVQRTLHEAMGVEEEVGSQNAEGKSEEIVVVEVEAPAAFAGLAPSLSGFLAALLQQPQWKKTEAQELARSHGTMLAGAIEKINDWAFEELGEQLIFDEGDVLSVEVGLIE